MLIKRRDGDLSNRNDCGYRIFAPRLSKSSWMVTTMTWMSRTISKAVEAVQMWGSALERSHTYC